MKHLRLIFTALLLGLVVSCGKKENPDPTPSFSLSVTPESLTFKADDTQAQYLAVTTTATWSAQVSDSWIKISESNGTGRGAITVKVEANNTGSSRNGSVVVKATSGGATKESRVSLTQTTEKTDTGELIPQPAAFDGNKRSSTTYQLLVYSFADSDGDGVGDFKGIQDRLDYLDGLGVTALWLSPVHPASNYHGYDVEDYYALNPQYAVGEKTPEKAEADFKELLAAAHDKGIQIYFDYVLNHSSKYHPWFQDAVANPSSPYRDYYLFSSNPSADYSKFPMLKGTTYQAGEWKQVTTGSPKIKITKTTEAVTAGTESWNLYMWQEGAGDKMVRFVKKDDGTYYLVMEINGDWGILVRKYPNWDAGSKFGAKSGGAKLQEGVPMELVADGQDISFNGNGKYLVELTDVSTETLFYMGCFSDWMPDLNYGDVDVAESNACFQDLAASADKWIGMGIDGLRLDAVKHICGGIGSYNNASNRTLLKKWYEHCNATYKAAGHSDNIFIVAEAWEGHSVEKTFYESINSCFEFDYGYTLRDMLNGGNAMGFADRVYAYVTDHTAQRADAITSFFLSNHDQDRFANELGKDVAKEKQAAAILLTSPGKPFVYQGEELGYWGVKSSGDEYVRTPILWDKAGKQCAKKGVNDKVDTGMLKAEISVESQSANDKSILKVYQTWSRLRNTYPALASGQMTIATSISGNSFTAWYMTAGNQKLLVIHNVASSSKSVTVSDSMAKPIAVLGTGNAKDGKLTLGANSSVVFEL